MRIYDRDWPCEQAILMLHDLRVDYITEQLYDYSMNGTIQCTQHTKIIHQH